MSTSSFFWHDYETFGLDPQRDFPAQFAGIRTDADFKPIDKPVVLYCKPSDDCLPHPDACVLTGIIPQFVAEKGLCEAQFITEIHAQMAAPNTCTLGYNNLRFDDEVTRNALYRNFFDPYQREWQNGNSRWDLIDVARATRALRPDGIVWTDDADGKPSFRLTALTQANGLEHSFAHDALSDVEATIAVARLIKQKQPKLFDFLWTHRPKDKVLELLKLGQFKPVVHVSGKYLARKFCLAIVLPLCQHPTNNNGIIVYDLSVDPQPLLELGVAEIQQRIFTAIADLPEGVARIPLKTVHINRCPVLAPISVIKPEDAQRLQLDLDLCYQHILKIQHAPALAAKLAAVFSTQFAPITDPDLMIYSGGFLGNADKTMLNKIRITPISQLAQLKPHFVDSRLNEMFFRYKARNYPEILTVEEQYRWKQFCLTRLLARQADYLQRLNELKQLPETNLALIAQLEDYLAQKLHWAQS